MVLKPYPAGVRRGLVVESGDSHRGDPGSIPGFSHSGADPSKIIKQNIPGGSDFYWF